jgi:hypothetical protein
LCPQRFCKGKNKGEIGEKDMETYQIEATIEKLEPKSIQLKGAGKYLFEKTDEKDEDKKYWNILSSTKPEIVPLSITYSTLPITYSFLSPNVIGNAFLEKKKLKFDLEEKVKGKEYTITAVSNAST